uniref:Pectinesterase inhibitor domain-containing protein n=1 Tax=Hordeum vulgare subsp. vulgare TaxID=112509 RepID=A0A8I6Y0C9_HORVV
MSVTSILFSAITIMLLSTTIATESTASGGGNPKATNFMVEACKNASTKSQIYDPNPITQEFCVLSLKLDNRSAEAKDVHSLVHVAIDILKGQVATANDNVKQMMHDTKNGTSTMRSLSFCVVDYNRMVSILSICDTMINEYHGRTGRADDGLLSSELPACVEKVDKPFIDCWLGLLGMEVKKLLDENIAVGMLVKLNFYLASII